MKQPKLDIMKTDISDYQITKGSLKGFLPMLACNKYVLVTNIGYNVGISERRAQISISFTLGIPVRRSLEKCDTTIHFFHFYFFWKMRCSNKCENTVAFLHLFLDVHTGFPQCQQIFTTPQLQHLWSHLKMLPFLKLFTVTGHKNLYISTCSRTLIHTSVWSTESVCCDARKSWITFYRPQTSTKKQSYTPWWVVVVSIFTFCPCLPGLKCYPTSHTNRPKTQQCKWNQYYVCIASQFEGQCLKTVEATRTSEPYSSILPSTLNLCSITQITCRAAKGTKQYPLLA